MADQTAPQSPEEYPREVRQELQQRDVTHEGEARQVPEARLDEPMAAHFGAVETEQTPVTPPMEGPSRLTEGTQDDLGIDPQDEILGG